MLDSKQLADLESAERDLNDKQTILNTAIDLQALLRFLVDNGAIDKITMDKYRSEVRESPKYKTAQTYITQTLAEIRRYKNDPEAQLKRMFEEKMKGR